MPVRMTQFAASPLITIPRGDGITDQGAAINAIIANSPPGSLIYFGGNHVIGSTILLLPNRTYLGPIGYLNGFTFQQLSGKNLPAVLASSDWYNNSATSGYPLRLYNIAVDGNSANNTTSHGIIIMNFDSIIDGCSAVNVPAAGIVASSISQNGTSVSNTCVETRIQHCKVNNCGTYGIWGHDTGGKLTDGYCLNNIVSSTTLDTILLERSAGWHIEGNHVYGGQQNGITALSCFATFIRGNYIDGFGGNTGAPPGTFYQGIFAQLLGGRDTIISDNYATSSESVANVTYQYISVFGIDTAFTIAASVIGNRANGAGTTRGVGYTYDKSGPALATTITDFGNSAININTSYSLGAAILGAAVADSPVKVSNSSTIFSGTGSPAAGLGNNGDFYFRTDTPGTANQRLYVKAAGAWSGIL